MKVGRTCHSLASGSVHFKLSFFLTTHLLPELGMIRHAHLVKPNQNKKHKNPTNQTKTNQPSKPPKKLSLIGPWVMTLAKYSQWMVGIFLEDILAPGQLTIV